MFIVASLYEVATVDVLAGNNNDVNLVETQTVCLQDYSIVVLFWENKQTRPWLLIGQLYHACFPPETRHGIGFIPSIPEHVQRWQESWLRSINDTVASFHWLAELTSPILPTVATNLRCWIFIACKWFQKLEEWPELKWKPVWNRDNTVNFRSLALGLYNFLRGFSTTYDWGGGAYLRDF